MVNRQQEYHIGLPGNEVETLLRAVFDDIDFFAAGFHIARAAARIGVTIPRHPVAERFLDAPTTERGERTSSPSGSIPHA
jgi:hypothetical protein